MECIIVKRENGYSEYPITSKIKKADMLKPFCWMTVENERVLYLQDKRRVFERKETITIAATNADIAIPQIEEKIYIENNFAFIQNIKEIYINSMLCTESKILLSNGDTLLIGNCKIILDEKEITVIADMDEIEVNLLEKEIREIPFEGFPKYKRSPRIIKNISQETIEIQKPTGKAQMKKSSLVQMIVSPLVMVAVTITMGIVMKRGIYVFVSALTTVLTTILSIVRYLGERKECKEKDKKRVLVYEEYLLNTRKRLNKLKKDEKDSWGYNYPNVTQIENMVINFNSRIYERNANDNDFLAISLGNSKSKAGYSIKLAYDELSAEKDEMEIEAREIKDFYTYIENKPIVVDLKKAHLGLVGEKVNIHEQLKLIVSQLTFLHSYHDFQIINIYQEKYKEEFQWMRWYPHNKIRAINVSGNIYSERTRDQILGSMHQIIKERKQKRDESKKEARFLPHFLFIIDEPKLIMDHSIMEYLEKEGDELGFSIIYTTQLKANLPEYIGTILILENSETGMLLLEEKKNVNKKILLNRAGNIQFENIARNLSILIHEKGVVSQIPESITFFEMYEIEKPEELHIIERWKQNESHKTLAVPLGVRAEKDYVYLNLHEKAHGPHGLVAGTTGSGKSEIVQSYILSLAVNFHPYEVGFLLIDYKGGGMASLFKNLPHLLGTITNLDGSESMRAMASIKSELARRQIIFNQYEVNHINAYNKLYKEGKASEPIPHLFLISDEFAELKKEQPEFMSELVSAARIGRSLGIHLILATQKPSGVVDDQIWTNSKFKLALKVQNESDSKEILKTADAAAITQAGRAYLQVGNNEIYELFQSAWSGAFYSEEEREDTVDNRVYLVNELGQGELINSDLSEKGENNKLRKTQLDVTVSYIQNIFEALGEESVRKPWMPSLPVLLKSPYVQKRMNEEINIKQKVSLDIALGIVDIPEQQAQIEYIHNFLEDGNLAVFSAPGFGKSTLLTTVLMSLAVKNMPELIKYYILDFGNSALIPLKNLPHTADYMNFDDSNKIAKLVKILTEEIKQRKILFAQMNAINFEMYNHLADKKLQAIILVIDNYDMIKELETELEPFLAILTRDGIGLGIYTVITASRLSAIRFNVSNNFNKKIALYLYDKSEANSCVGRTNYPVGEIKGRGLVKLENVNQMQVYVTAEGETPIENMENLKNLIGQIAIRYEGRKNKGIPMLPEALNISNFREFCTEDLQKNKIPIGLDTERVEVQYLNLKNTKQIIVGTSQSGKTNLIKVLLQLRDESIDTYLLASREGELFEFHGKQNLSYIQGMEKIAQFLLDLEGIIEERQENLEEARRDDPHLLPRKFFEMQDSIMVIIEDWDYFIEMLKETKNNAADKIIMEAVTVGVTFIAVTSNSKMRGIDSLSKFMKDTIYGVILGTPSEQSLFSIPGMRMLKPELGIGFLNEKSEITPILIPKA